MKIKAKIVSCHTADSKTGKQEVNGTVILPPLVFPGSTSARGGAIMLAHILATLNVVILNVVAPHFVITLIVRKYI